MGGRQDADGRLDLDDLGHVVDAAHGVVAAERHDIVDDGRGSTWAERLEAAGVLPWARRHRRALTGTTLVAALILAAVAAHVRLTPPPLDPELRVSVTEVVSSSYRSSDDVVFAVDTIGLFALRVDGPVRAAYGLTPTDPADTAAYAVLGLTGPAVRASTPHAHAPLVTGEPFASDVDVVLDCSDTAALDPAPGSYALVVSRTDASGRTVTGRVPVPDADEDWPAYVAQRCLGQQSHEALTLRSATVRPDARTHSVTLDLAVTNSLPIDLVAASVPAGGFPAVVIDARQNLLPARGDAVIPVTVQVRDCAAPAMPLVGLDRGNGAGVGSVPGTALLVHRTSAARTTPGARDFVDGGGLATVRWSDAVQRMIDGALRTACTGAPKLALRVLRAGRGAPTAMQLPIGGGALVGFPVSWEVTTSGRAVRLESPVPAEEEYVDSVLEQASSPVRDGRAVVAATWAVECSSRVVAPPTVRVIVSTARGDYPFQVRAADGPLAVAMQRACAGPSMADLVDAGWRRPESG